MNIGYGSVSIYDSIRHPLYYENKQIAYFDVQNKRYKIKLEQKHIKAIENGKNLDVVLSKLTPREIEDNSNHGHPVIFKSPTITIVENKN